MTTMLTSESEDNMETFTSSPRLGQCEVCNGAQALYTCPKCEIKSCCLKCVNIHKKELNCDGVRDRTKYIPLKKMTKLDLLNDYRFLEECGRFVDDRKRDKQKHFTRYNKTLPPSLFRLRGAARERGTTLRFLLQNFSKHQRNTSQLNFKTAVIHWHLEWCFPNAEGLVFTDERCSENNLLYVLLDKYLDTTNGKEFAGKSKLEFYQSRNLNQLRILLKAEGIKRCRNRFYELDPKKTLKENLKDKTIVEYPSLVVIFRETEDQFDIIESDEDVVAETKMYQQHLDNHFNKRRRQQPSSTDQKEKNPKEEQDSKLMLRGLDRMEIVRKRDERRKKREQASKEPTNLLFSDESLWNQYSSTSSETDGGATEEEDEKDGVMSPKRVKV
ncbi:box C/D snoRNA protein 1 [Uranotaenia lowii]|uniref:box C/D snoRNA protein 1 n=1 Tax=Uranotaenia lowii TaxID=190385 RepID=UPI00247A0D40|nr:box C/D snoRNA protein 1 [Uranotaenia lowii]